MRWGCVLSFSTIQKGMKFFWGYLTSLTQVMLDRAIAFCSIRSYVYVDCIECGYCVNTEGVVAGLSRKVAVPAVTDTNDGQHWQNRALFIVLFTLCG